MKIIYDWCVVKKKYQETTSVHIHGKSLDPNTGKKLWIETSDIGVVIPRHDNKYCIFSTLNSMYIICGKPSELMEKYLLTCEWFEDGEWDAKKINETITFVKNENLKQQMSSNAISTDAIKMSTVVIVDHETAKTTIINTEEKLGDEIIDGIVSVFDVVGNAYTITSKRDEGREPPRKRRRNALI